MQKEQRIRPCFCHHEDAKGLSVFGVHRYLCSRCLGIGLGAILAVLIYYLGIQIRVTAAVLLMIPLVLDGVIQTLKFHQSRNDIRLISGALFGLGLNVLGLIR